MNGRVYCYKNGKMNGISSQGDGPRRLGRPGAPPRQAPPAGATTSCRRLWQPRQRRRVLAAVSAHGGCARRHVLPAARLPRDAMARRPRGVRRPRGGPTSSPAGRPLAGRRCCSAAASGWTHSAASSGSPDRSTASTAAASSTCHSCLHTPGPWTGSRCSSCLTSRDGAPSTPCQSSSRTRARRHLRAMVDAVTALPPWLPARCCAQETGAGDCQAAQVQGLLRGYDCRLDRALPGMGPHLTFSRDTANLRGTLETVDDPGRPVFLSGMASARRSSR